MSSSSVPNTNHGRRFHTQPRQHSRHPTYDRPPARQCSSRPRRSSSQSQSSPSPPLVVNPNGTDVPVKRKPGRPKGSGKKPIDPNAEPKIKRPVGRPRKDGLPAGSVGPRRASRPRKRPPGTFASVSQLAVYPYAPPYPNFAQVTRPSLNGAPQSPHRPWAPSPVASANGLPDRPKPGQDDWAVLSRTRPDVFLHGLSPPWPSRDAFKSHLASLAPNARSPNTPPIPSLYSISKTFWLPSSPVYFALTASATARTPSEHRFLYWDPHPLVFNGIACPACSAPLINRGRIASGPLKVFDLGAPFYVIGCEYVCKSPVCLAGTSPDGRRFASTDMSILRALPSKLTDEFPAHLLPGAADLGSAPEVWNWSPIGVSVALWNMARASLRTGMRKEALLDVVRTIQEGLREDEQPKQEEEEEETPEGEDDADEDGDADADEHDAQQVEGDLDYAQNKPAEQFGEPWGANGAGGGAPQPEAGPSHSADAAGHAHGHAAPQDDPARPPQYPPYGQAQYMPYPYPPYPYYQQGPAPPAPAPQGESANLLKRAFSLVGAAADADAEPLQKRIRHCCKCGSNECKGKGGRAFCTNPCQDCGKLECRGRNSKRPDRTCSDAWP
ncbi:hypothetical protein B0H21DRAFT_845640 [Amylocystis lapponica]|nr:hypothetical protein B0H21DRAFT_845640 [Amylocystis lapponica]